MKQQTAAELYERGRHKELENGFDEVIRYIEDLAECSKHSKRLFAKLRSIKICSNVEYQLTKNELEEKTGCIIS
jgi:uncharacterized protein YwgA